MASYRWLTCLLLTPAVAFANAQWYEIEVLGFAYEKPTITDETWPALSGFPDIDNAATISHEQTPEHLMGIRRIPKSQRDFNDSYKNINYSDKTRVLFHDSWEQYINDDKNISIRLHGGKRIKPTEAIKAPQPIYTLEKESFNFVHNQMIPDYILPPYPWEIEGTIEMRLSRYMHVDTDFVFQTDAGQPIRSKSSVKMRSDEVHYVDHPYFGLLLRINKKRS